MDWQDIWVYIRKYMLNKYVITCLGFAVMLTFCGRQSFIHQIGQERQIRELKKELKGYQNQREHYREAIDELQSTPEQLEKYAREHYYMHAPNEDIYLIEE